ncbi:MAG: flagellar basal body rod protein FlgC [Polaromonas sp.]|nr:flagellar basal body rod protein FlgC [Polaromonas sp.]
MALDNIFGIAGSALNSQTVRMNTIASNLANAGTVSGSDQDAFRAKRAVFKAIMDQQVAPQDSSYQGGVKVQQIKDDPTPVRRMLDPGNPLADKEGYVYSSNVNEMGEMVDMMAASRSYQNNVEVINTARQLMMRTLEITKA